MKFAAKNKVDLAIEVWEYLDCESVGAKELIAIENAIRERFGESAVDSPMVTARLLADEGAQLRHSEIMALYLDRAERPPPHDAALKNLFDLSDLHRAENSLKRAENLRRKLLSDEDQNGLRLLRKDAIDAKSAARNYANDKRLSEEDQRIQNEAAEWITLWLQSPELFENWVKMRKASKDFKTAFAKDR
jgi:hypothetical protein